MSAFPDRTHPLGRPQQTLSRRAFGRGVGALAVLGALAACGRDTASTTTDGPTTVGTTASALAGSSAPSAAVTDSFPLTVAHQLGTTTVPAAPQRIVSVGLTEQDFVLALGQVPIAVTDWYGDQPHAIWPWATAALGSATPPTVLNSADGIDYLEVAGLKPDLILGLNAGLDAESYARVSQIAPTIGPPLGTTNQYFDSWQSYLQTIAAAMGRSAQGAALEKSVKDTFAQAAAAHPQFAGKNVIWLQNAVSDGNFYAYPQGLGTEFLTDLGFAIPDVLDQYVPAEGGQALIPAERIAVLDAADYLVWATESDADRTALEALPGFAELAAVKAGRSVYTGAVLSGAMYFASPLSLPYVADNLVPLLAGA